MSSAFEALERREMVEDASNREQLRSLLATPGASIYIGFDPTARSLHVGHLLPVMALAQLQRLGHRPLMLVGGATGMIGDPSGRIDERQLLTPQQLEENVEGVRSQLAQFVDFSGQGAAVMVNNKDWIGPYSHLEWLRDVGKHFTVNYMMAKRSVSDRIEREQGLSYTEFSYMLLQAFDFLHLYRKYGCRIQGGGSDQWGNITAGIDLVRKVTGDEVFGITFPLVKTASGEKFGKSAGNAVWLSAALTSPYRFFQYWMQTDDRDVAKYLRFFTFLPPSEIEEIVIRHDAAPEDRLAQRRLALEVTSIVHGATGADRGRRASEMLFGGEIAGLSDDELDEVFDDVPSVEIPRSDLASGLKLQDVLVRVGACASKGEARRLIQSGGVYLNNRRVTDVDEAFGPGSLATERTAVLRTGKRTYFRAKVSAGT